RDQARNFSARAEDRPAARRVLGVVGGDDVEIATIVAAEAEAGHELRRHVGDRVELARRREARDAAARRERDEDATRLVDRKTVGGLPFGILANTRRFDAVPSSAMSCASTTPAL